MKLLHYNDRDVKHYFWRTTQRQEIDLIEESHEQWAAFECKRRPKSTEETPVFLRLFYSH